MFDSIYLSILIVGFDYVILRRLSVLLKIDILNKKIFLLTLLT